MTSDVNENFQVSGHRDPTVWCSLCYNEESLPHASHHCPWYITPEEKRYLLLSTERCPNCARSEHPGYPCPDYLNCQFHPGERHYTWLCYGHTDSSWQLQNGRSPINDQQQTGETTQVSNAVSNAKEGILSITPTIIVPLIASSGLSPFRVRTLLDSGSNTNWILSSILSQISHQVIGSETMEVSTFQGITKKTYQVIEVYYRHHSKEGSITCYVHDTTVRHIAVKGMVNHIISNSSNKLSIFNQLVDPATNGIDHNDHPGIAMILSPSAINQLRDPHQEITYLKEVDILLHPTKFGVAISGTIPNHLRSNTGVSTANFISASPVSKETDLVIPVKTQEIQLIKISSLEIPKKQINFTENFHIDCNVSDKPEKSKPKSTKSQTNCNYLHGKFMTSNIAPKFLLMFILTLVTILCIKPLLHIFVALSHILYIFNSRDLSQNQRKASLNSQRPTYSKNKVKFHQHCQNRICSISVNASKFHSKVRCLLTSHRHKSHLKCQSKVYWDRHIGENNPTFVSQTINFFNNSTFNLFSFITNSQILTSTILFFPYFTQLLPLTADTMSVILSK